MAPYRAPGPSFTPAKPSMSRASACPCLGPSARLTRISSGGSFSRRRPPGGRRDAMTPSYYVTRSYARRSKISAQRFRGGGCGPFLVTTAASTPLAPPATRDQPQSQARNRSNVTARRLYPYQCHIATVPAAPPPLLGRHIQRHQGHRRCQEHRPHQLSRTSVAEDSLGEQGVAVVLTRPQARLDGEHGAAGVVDVLVEGVGGQRRLELYELGGILHEPDEEQPAEQRPGLRVDAVGEGVAAAQDVDPAVVLRAGQPDVRVGRDGGLPVGAGPGEVRRGELRPPGQRRPADLGPADDVLLVLEVVAVP